MLDAAVNALDFFSSEVHTAEYTSQQDVRTFTRIIPFLLFSPKGRKERKKWPPLFLLVHLFRTVPKKGEKLPVRPMTSSTTAKPRISEIEIYLIDYMCGLLIDGDANEQVKSVTRLPLSHSLIDD